MYHSTLKVHNWVDIKVLSDIGLKKYFIYNFWSVTSLLNQVSNSGNFKPEYR